MGSTQDGYNMHMSSAHMEKAGKESRSFLGMPGIYLAYLDNGRISPNCDWPYFLEISKTPFRRL